MREIKFRAWDGEKMSSSFTLKQALYRTDTWDDFGENWDGTFMQYTGLKDKNGKEIYEGDVVADNPRKTFIQCHGEYDSAEVVKMKDIDGSDDMGTDCIGYPYYWEDFEVIGNIYENPELLTNNPTNDN